MSAYTIDEVVEAYIALRQQKRDLEKAQEEALIPFNEKLDKIEAHLLGRMNQEGVDSYKTKHGTAYRSVKASVKIADSNIYKQFIFTPVAKMLSEITGMPVESFLTPILESALWSLVDFRAGKKGVEEYIGDTKQVPPGLDVAQTTSVNVRSR